MVIGVCEAYEQSFLIIFEVITDIHTYSTSTYRLGPVWLLPWSNSQHTIFERIQCQLYTDNMSVGSKFCIDGYIFFCRTPTEGPT